MVQSEPVLLKDKKPAFNLRLTDFISGLADEDFYVFSKEGDSWISVVGNVNSIHETTEGFTLKLSNSPHESSFLKRTDEGYNLVNFDKGEISKSLT
jgi:hypothetical protein